MKRTIIALIFLLGFTVFFTLEVSAQSDAFFAITKEQRTDGTNGLMFSGFSGGIGEGFGQQNGLTFEDFIGKENTPVPVGNGGFIMAITSVLYLVTKRRKEDK